MVSKSMAHCRTLHGYVDAWSARHQVDIYSHFGLVEGKNHLHSAARKGQFRVIKLMYRISVVLTRRESHGMTPSGLARSHGVEEQ